MKKVSAIVLGAGTSQRMGKENKLFLPIAGRSMIDRVIEQVLSSEVDEIILVVSELSIQHLQKWESEKIVVLLNEDYQTGMTSSIQTGVKKSAANGYMICLGDQPKIRTSTYNHLMETFKQSQWGSIILPYFNGEKGNPVIFSSDYKDAILQHKESNGCRAVIESHSDQVVCTDVDDPGVLMDIDTWEDYQTYR
jgi:molybdenum cofactor cytidylyltransferase